MTSDGKQTTWNIYLKSEYNLSCVFTYFPWCTRQNNTRDLHTASLNNLNHVMSWQWRVRQRGPPWVIRGGNCELFSLLPLLPRVIILQCPPTTTYQFLNHDESPRPQDFKKNAMTSRNGRHRRDNTEGSVAAGGVSLPFSEVTMLYSYIDSCETLLLRQMTRWPCYIFTIGIQHFTVL